MTKDDLDRATEFLRTHQLRTEIIDGVECYLLPKQGRWSNDQIELFVASDTKLYRLAKDSKGWIEVGGE